MSKWYLATSTDSDVIMSTRIRLARNLKDMPFPCRMSHEQKQQVISDVRGALENINLGDEYALTYLDMENMPKSQALAMVERHLISPEFAENRKGEGLLLSKNESVSIMINEEDHIRIQVIKEGNNADEALKLANQIDDLLDEHLAYAFDERLGYLTQCPTNLGTGLRASVMLHLPLLESTGYIGRIANTISKLGLTIRGTYGEGTQVKGAFYQLSNQVTLGISEQAAIENLIGISNQIVTQERSARKAAQTQDILLEDKVCRALGILQNARIVSSKEFMELISYVRLGVAMGILQSVSLENVNSLLADAGPASILAQHGEAASPGRRDKIRADMIRQRLTVHS